MRDVDKDHVWHDTVFVVFHSVSATGEVSDVWFVENGQPLSSNKQLAATLCGDGRFVVKSVDNNNNNNTVVDNEGVARNMVVG